MFRFGLDLVNYSNADVGSSIEFEWDGETDAIDITLQDQTGKLVRASLTQDNMSLIADALTIIQRMTNAKTK